MGDKAPTTIKEVAKLLAELSAKVDAHNNGLKNEMQEINQAVQFMNSHFEELKKTLETLRKDNATLKKDNAALREGLDAARSEIIDLKQYSRQQNLEIKGLPLKKDEDLTNSIILFAEKFAVPLSPDELDVVHRVPSKDKTKPNVVVKCRSRSTRNRILQVVKKKKITPADFGFEGDGIIYVNEHLCPENKVLLGKAISKKREKNWKFVWFSNGKVLARKAENSNVIHIRCENDVSLIC